MSDDLWAPRPKQFRRRRKSTGEEFTEHFSDELKDLEAARRQDRGLYCKECRHRISWSKIVVRYELQSGDICRIWFCPDCGNMLKEDNLEWRSGSPEVAEVHLQRLGADERGHGSLGPWGSRETRLW